MFNYKLAIACIFSVVLMSCSPAQVKKYTTVKKPEIKFQQYQIISVSEKKVKIDLLFKAYNPNDIAIDSFFVNYELFVNDKSFIKGLKAKLKLIPKGNSIIKLPIDISYRNLLSSVTSVAGLIAKGKRKLPMAADIEIFGQFKVVEFIKKDFRFQKKVDLAVPLPKYSMNDILKYIQRVR
ncbi:hypothetical protein MNBD_GAMMA22-2166 [hydrothermal vent metagenome]|uniref:Late embryogenesis abundant protein LEA-2 subgroup domain-containing protein n=1 Tax=hydrothermal vent metagenome TaxID=652676 RepID=A0A3B0ZY38_9ZZZZ